MRVVIVRRKKRAFPFAVLDPGMLVAFQLSLPRWSSDRKETSECLGSKPYVPPPSSAGRKLSLVLWRAFERIHCFEGARKS